MSRRAALHRADFVADSNTESADRGWRYWQLPGRTMHPLAAYGIRGPRRVERLHLSAFSELMHVVTDRTIQPVNVDPFVLESWVRLSLRSMTRITGLGLLLLVRNGKCFGMNFMAVGTRQAYLVMYSAFPQHSAPTAFGFAVTAETCVNLLRRGRSVGPNRTKLNYVAKAETAVSAGYMKTPRSVTGFASLLRIRRV